MDKFPPINNKNIKKISSYENNDFIVTKMVEKLIDVFKLTNVGTIKIMDKEYIIKKEYFKDYHSILKFIYNLIELDVNEYKFYKKYSNKIIKFKFETNIQLPIKYKIQDTSYLYIFSKIDSDLNKKFLEKINKKTFINIVSQIIFISYFLNHKLNIFHNDLFLMNNLRNLMINTNKTPYYLRLDNYRLKVEKYRVIFIDFGLFGKELKFKNTQFYYHKNIKYLDNFIIRSELLAILYLVIKNYYNKKNINFKKLYYYYYDQIKIKNLKNFDKCILDNVDEIYKIIENFIS
jgi:hypothetical protein